MKLKLSATSGLHHHSTHLQGTLMLHKERSDHFASLLTSKSSQDGCWYNWFPLLHRITPFLNVVFEGHGRFAQTQGLAAVILEALVGWHTLQIHQGGLAVPGLQHGIRALVALSAAVTGFVFSQLAFIK